MKHVIIGNGPAGLVAAETLRRLQPDAEIALIGDESEPPYSRMAIPYFLIGKIADSGTHLRKAHDHYARERIHLIEGKVVKVDAQAKQVEFASGERLPYDRLLIASGSHPIRPKVSGMDLANVHTCWTIEDARAIAAKAALKASITPMGARAASNPEPRQVIASSPSIAQRVGTTSVALCSHSGNTKVGTQAPPSMTRTSATLPASTECFLTHPIIRSTLSSRSAARGSASASAATIWCPRRGL